MNYYNIKDVDVIAVVDNDTKDIYYISLEEARKTAESTITLRLKKTLNKQTKGVRYASEFRAFPQ